MDLGLTIETNDRQLVAHLEALPERMRAALRPKITEFTNALLARVLAAEPEQTGYLRSQTHAYIDERVDFIRGRVRILRTGHASRAGAQFGALEYGAHRQFAVRPYRRRSGPVGGYQRQANIAARRFLRGSAAGMRERAVAEIKTAIAEALQPNRT